MVPMRAHTRHLSLLQRGHAFVRGRASATFFGLLFVGLLAGCGSGGSSSGGGSTPTPTVGGASEVLISGRAAKGTVLSATVRATQIINGQLSATHKDVALGPNGDFSVSMPKGLVHLKLSHKRIR